MWIPLGIRKRAQKVGEKLLVENPTLICGLQETDNGRFRFINRQLVRLDRLCNGKSAFRKRSGHRLEISNQYFGNEK